MLGNATFITNIRRKEVGIRKVMGASSGTLLRMLLLDFAKPVMIATVSAAIRIFSRLFSAGDGAVEEVFVEEGSFVEAGQPLLQLSNTNLRLSAAQNDTNITEQLNLLNNITDGFETTKLSTQRQIIDTEYRIIVLERQRTRH